ncbi:unnamed protein product [Parnassius apollo]|uniref:(apollo) hypothetical protein n=1 Tax=Parnassius apollo TaxID=110799 RepID=A0A8S3XUT1_PARAO|nr:unnamed protein product [Parnassius apollo]
MNDNSSGEERSAADVWVLPAEELHGLWENLIYDSQLKEDFWNRFVLLHGPPGTGKTSLCRALAQKLAIRLSDRFPRARLVEINAQCLFSKWFSESGKLVAKLFDRIRMILEDRRLLVCTLVDEVESLTHARRATLAGLEPSDSIRTVNVILTQLDRLKRYPNALVLTTSNVTEAIDVAFVDRADNKRLVEPPSERTAYEILRGCCYELRAHGAVAPPLLLCAPLFSLRVLEGVRFVESDGSRASLRLLEVARSTAAAGASARALRRLAGRPRCRASSTFDALRAALAQQLRDAAYLCNSPAPTSPSF